MKNKVLSILLIGLMFVNFLNVGSLVTTLATESPVNLEETTEGKDLKIVAVIPARYESSRFPGKPLADICGKPMVWWVYQQAKKVPELSEVYVATDDERIETVCKQYDMNVIMTSKSHPTGTDRVAEVAEKIQADLYVNIQGDEPLVAPGAISKCIMPFLYDKNLSVSTIMTKINNPNDLLDPNVVKILTNKNNEVIYISRSPIPYLFGNTNCLYYEHIGVYAIKPKALNFYHNSPREKIEKMENIELLRFIENQYKINCTDVDYESISVDTPKDLDRVREIMQQRLKQKHIKMLDCTLRDGGYINAWNFGENNIKGIINKLISSNTDVIEIGYYEPNSVSTDNVNNTIIKDLNMFDKFLKINKDFCVMLDPIKNNVSINNIPKYTNGKINTIRICFYKKDANEALNFCKLIKEKGYKVFVQPMVASSYSNEEFLNLIKCVNNISTDAFYIVDSHGTMSKEQLLNLFNIADKNLNKGIQIGFHSHNNLQQAFSNAQALMELDTKRDIIIDSSVFGMGRVAGNLCTELLMQYLNEKQGENYNLKPIYKIFDEHLSDIFENTKWGYSIPLFISAKYKCHPNYVIFLNKVGIRRVQDIDEIISKVSEDKKSVFDKNYIEKLYEDFYKGNTKVLPLIIF